MNLYIHVYKIEINSGITLLRVRRKETGLATCPALHASAKNVAQ